ncbi:MAG TPA: hypothetical protein VIA18_05980, partial [Polyangia bacterium]|nr:hypothetical protein [Polyangia bacterium]
MSALLLAIRIVVAATPVRIEANAAAVRVTVATAPGVKLVRLWCSAGTISPPEPTGDGRFEADYRPPA